jgi:hypothetical protein
MVLVRIGRAGDAYARSQGDAQEGDRQETEQSAVPPDEMHWCQLHLNSSKEPACRKTVACTPLESSV